MKTLKCILSTIILYAVTQVGVAQHDASKHDVKLHINPKWDECSFQLDPSLTQKAWHQFTQEAGLVAYFRPLTDAKPMGKWNFEVSLLQWATAFDDTDAAWNDTFVHPDSTHWLKEGSRLGFPGLTARVGITDRMDVGFYFTKSPGANYGFFGGQLQYNLINKPEKNWAASTRLNFMSLYGPEDLKFNSYGVDFITSKEIPLHFRWASISPYVGVSTYLFSSHETSEKVDLHDENVVGAQAMVGAVLKLSKAQLGVEYNFAKINTLSFKVGVAF